MRKFSYKNFKNILKQIKSEWNVNIRIYNFSNKTGAAGVYDENIRTIHVNLRIIKDDYDIACIICHELGHVYCFDYNKYPIYHHRNTKRSKKWKIAFKRTMVRAERYVDDLGEEFYSQYFPDFKEKYYGYYNATDRKEVYDYLYNYYKDNLSF